MFRRKPSRGGRGRRAAADFVVCIGCGTISSFFFVSVFFPLERTRTAASMKQPCLIYLSTNTGVRTGLHGKISLSACLSVCLSVCLSACLSVCQSSV